MRERKGEGPGGIDARVSTMISRLSNGNGWNFKVLKDLPPDLQFKRPITYRDEDGPRVIDAIVAGAEIYVTAVGKPVDVGILTTKETRLQGHRKTYKIQRRLVVAPWGTYFELTGDEYRFLWGISK